MDSIVFNYLRNYREKYNIDDLRKEILSKGYSEIEFDDALNELKKNDLMSGGKNNFKYKSLGENPTPKKKKNKFGIVFSIMIIVVLIVVILNYLGISIGGFNIFEILS
jgi:multidrug efflux pump subunit AcrB